MTSLVLALAVAVAAPVPKEATENLLEKVDAARIKAIQFLKSEQDKNGSWENSATGAVDWMKGGPTALVALALLEAGVPANDPAITKAIEYLLLVDRERTYVVSLQAQVLARVDAKKHAKVIQANVDWLMKAAIVKGKKLEGWSYLSARTGDNSNTHFAVAALHAAARCGAKVDAGIWEQIREYLTRTQQKDGGWPYASPGNTSRNMITVGLLCLAIAGKHAEQAQKMDPAFEKGMAVLLAGKFVGGASEYYDLFTTAELGRVLGSNEFKAGKLTRAWYLMGAEKLVKEQRKDGSWKAEEGLDKSLPVVTTAFGLYFLGPPAKK